MGVKIFHTADVHLGLKFNSRHYGDLKDSLVEARIEALQRMVTLANKEACHLFVVAGDLFDSVQVPKRTVNDAAKAIKEFDGLALVLPGNHDFIPAVDDQFWKEFADALGENHRVIRASCEIDLRDEGIPAVVYPGVCHSKHSKENAINWIAEKVTTEDVVKIGIAHGSLEGLSPDFNDDYFPMKAKQLEQAGVDVWLLGHTHKRHPPEEAGKNQMIFYPATPEPDGFDCSHEGFAWIVDVEPDGKTSFRSHQTGRFRFHTIEQTVHNESDITRIDNQIKAFDEASDLLKVKLSGRLSGEDYDRLKALEGEWQKDVRYAEIDTEGVLREMGMDEINEKFAEESFPHKLLTMLAKSNNTLAVQLANELIDEASS